MEKKLISINNLPEEEKNTVLDIYSSADEEKRNLISEIFDVSEIEDKYIRNWCDLKGMGSASKIDYDFEVCDYYPQVDVSRWKGNIHFKNLNDLTLASKMVAMYKIAELIQYGYGGKPRVEELKERALYSIVANFVKGKLEYRVVTSYDCVTFPYFYTFNDAKRFLEYNRELLDVFFYDKNFSKDDTINVP